MDSYNRKTDEELLRRMHNGDKKVIDYLMVKYKNLVRKKAKALFLIGADNDDLIQEGMIGLFKAIRDYQEEKDSSFYHFAEICISRQMYTAMEASQRKKHAPLNSYVSLDEEPDISDVWGMDYEGETRTLDMHVASLRDKIHKAGGGDCIVTVRGVGYRFEQ